MWEWKKFEMDFSRTQSDGVLIRRLRDSQYAWNVSLSDYELIWYNKVVFVELKSTKWKSINYEQYFSEKQNEMMVEARKANHMVECWFLLNFRSTKDNETYYIDVRKFNKIKKESDRKSISLKQSRKHWKPIKSFKRRTRYDYDEKWILWYYTKVTEKSIN